MPSPSTTLHKLSQPSLLDVSKAEKMQVSAAKLISGFSILSGVTSVVANNISGIPTVAQVSAFGALGLAGGIAGGVQAYYDISAEQTKAIKINKELFLMFNVAADKLEALKKINTSSKHADSPAFKILKEEYHECLTQIHATLSSPAEIVKEIQIEQKQERLSISNMVTDTKAIRRDVDRSPEHNRIHGIIHEYVNHRKSSSEHLIWKALKNNDVYAPDAQLANFFVEFNSVEETNHYFKEQRKQEHKNYLIHKIHYQDVLNNLSVEHVRKGDDLLKFVDLRHQINIMLDQIHDNGNFNDNIETVHHVRLKFQNLKALHISILHLLHDAAQQRLQKPVAKFIDVMNTVTNNSTNKKILLANHIPQLSNDTFGEQGTFRQFWRELPTKTYQVTSNEAIPLHFEQRIYRGGKAPSLTEKGLMGLGVGMGLFYTGKGLYAAAIALGATAIGSMGLSLLVGALALGLTLMCVYYYNKSKKTQNDRDQLYTRLNRGRACMFVNELNSKALTDIELTPVNDRVTLPAKPSAANTEAVVSALALKA